MNTLSQEKRAMIVRLLVEGNSLRSCSRIADVSFNTVLKFLPQLGAACDKFHNEMVRGVKSKRIQADEIWSFVYAKEKNVAASEKAPEGAGDVWTWTAIDADSKLIVSYCVGERDPQTAFEFMNDVKARLANRVQLTTDGLKAYLTAVDATFDGEIDFAQLVKIYGAPRDGESKSTERKYSPAECTGAEKKWVSGDPDAKHISTSYVERQNLTMRMGMRRFTRLTNAFSKKLENHYWAIALHFVYYNFCRIHKTLRVTPAMESKLMTKPMTIADIVNLIPVEAPKKRGPYKKKETNEASQ